MTRHIHFLGEDPRQAVDRARSLADDLARIVAGDGPTAADLSEAPILDCWALGVAAQPVLWGSVSGHPKIGDSPSIRTSLLFAIDGEHGMFARTLSRWYRLGRPLEDCLGRADQ